LTKLIRISLCASAAIAAILLMATAAYAAEGKVRYVKPAQSDLEPLVDQNKPFISQHYWRVRAYPPSWDRHLSWFPGAWAYKDAYALYNPRFYPPGHVSEPRADWILKDAQGRRLYIPFDCNGSYCSQFAADVGNPDFRRWWIDDAKRTIQKGYKGIFVDDLTLWARVGDGAGGDAQPIDPRTGGPMSDATWARYMAEFMEQLRRELPAGAEIVHNVLWYGPELEGPMNPYIRRQVAAADYLEVERGYTDTHPGTGKWSYETCLKWVDYVHSQGKGIVADSYTDSRQGAEYELAASLLVNEGRDSLSTGYKPRPGNWWSGYDVDLGAAKGRRYRWNGVYRRDFERGFVVVSPPGSSVSAGVGPGFRNLDGAPVSSVNLGSKGGAVLLGVTGPVELPPAQLPTQTVVQPIPNPPYTPPTTHTKPGSTPPPTGLPKPAKPRRIRLPHAVHVRGKVLRATSGRVEVKLQRKIRRRWRHVRKATVGLARNGRFRKTFIRLRRGRYRIRAKYLGHRKAKVSLSSARHFRIRF
jgi:hypothetical protein